ncbi:MAG: PDZ domain-containing protein, partial [Bdellovibrionota bacterium]
FFLDHFVEIDFSKNSLLVCPPSHEFSGRGEILPLRLDADTATPVVSARIDGTAGDFIVDTGDRTTLTIFEDFTHRNALKDHYSRIINLITGEGVGGPIRADVLRLASFALGAMLFQDFPTRFPLAADFSAEGYAGSIGDGLLKTHDVVFDYAHGQLILLSPSGLSYQGYDRSGLWLVTNEKGFRVSDVVPQSAAWNAGIRKDDVLVSVGGKNFSQWNLPALREFLASPDAKTVSVRASRGEQSLDFTMLPFPLI